MSDIQWSENLIRKVMLNNFPMEELKILSYELGLEWESFPGETKSAKAREIIVYMARRNRLGELVDEIILKRPHIDKYFPTRTPDPADEVEVFGEKIPSLYVPHADAATLELELANLRQQVLELREGLTVEEQQGQRFEELITTINSAVGRSADLTAEMILPPPEARNIRLIPEHHFDRLEEYSSDENVSYLLVGLFVGAAVGIIVNWATNDTFNPSAVSITFLAIFVALALATVAWVFRVKRRAKKVTNQIFPERVD